MSVHIELSKADVTCLANRLPLGSELRYELLNSGMIPTTGGANPIDCDEGEARALLRIAVEYCPEAVEKIQYGLRLSGVTNL